jgi:hypothetical protein
MLRIVIIATVLLTACSSEGTAPPVDPATADYFPLVSQKFTMADTCFASPALIYYDSGTWFPGTPGPCGHTSVSYDPVPIGSECTNAPSLAKTQTKNNVLAYWQQGYPGAWDSEVYSKQPDGSVIWMGAEGGESSAGPTRTKMTPPY